jgi:hypothetical protein
LLRGFLLSLDFSDTAAKKFLAANYWHDTNKRFIHAWSVANACLGLLKDKLVAHAKTSECARWLLAVVKTL